MKANRTMYDFNVTVLLSTPQQQISDCSKVCYQATHDRDITKSLVKSGHLAVLRFAYVTFNINNLSIPAHVQMLRSSHLEFLVKSLRYTGGSKHPIKTITPLGYSDTIDRFFKASFDASIKTYYHLLSCGVKKEDARAVLPTNTATELNVTGNLQAWSDFIKLRVSKHAQTEIRQIAIIVWSYLFELYPDVFPTEYIVNGKTLDQWLVTL